MPTITFVPSVSATDRPHSTRGRDIYYYYSCSLFLLCLVLSDGVIAGIISSIVILLVLIIIVILTIVVILIYKGRYYIVVSCTITTVCVCVLLVSSTKQSRSESSPVIKEFFSEKNEAYGIIKGSDDQSPIEVTENVAYSTMEQQPSLNTPPVYETIN